MCVCFSLSFKRSSPFLARVTPGCGGVAGGGAGSGGAGSANQASAGISACGGGAYIGGAVVEPKPFCKECGRGYSTISNLKQHVANIHSPTPQWVPCSICGKHFKTRQYLFNHLLQTHGIRQRANRMHLAQFAQPCATAVAPSAMTIAPVMSAQQPSSMAPQPIAPVHSVTAPLLSMDSMAHPGAMSSAPSKERDLNGAVEQCLQYLSSTPK